MLGGGLTLADQQKEFFQRVLHQNCPDLLSLYERSYPPGSYSQAQAWGKTGLRIREFCLQAGITDRMPRPVIAGEKRILNKRIVELLANQCYWMELEDVPSQRIWAYRKAAWAVEDLEQDIGLVYRTMGVNGLKSIPDVNIPLAREIEVLIKAA